MKNFFSENRKMLLTSLVVIVLFPIIILCKSPIGIIPLDVGLVIVTYGGAIFGGFLTLYGVWWTIESNREREREDKALQYRPILQYDICERNPSYQQMGEIHLKFDSKYFWNEEPFFLNQLIRLKNSGRGEANNIQINYLEGSLTSVSIAITEQSDFMGKTQFLGNHYINFLPINESLFICIGIPTVKEEYKDAIDRHFHMLINMKVGIQYEGLFTDKKYNQVIDLNLEVRRQDAEYWGKVYSSSTNLEILDRKI